MSKNPTMLEAMEDYFDPNNQGLIPFFAPQKRDYTSTTRNLRVQDNSGISKKRRKLANTELYEAILTNQGDYECCKSQCIIPVKVITGSAAEPKFSMTPKHPGMPGAPTK